MSAERDTMVLANEALDDIVPSADYADLTQSQRIAGIRLAAGDSLTKAAKAAECRLVDLKAWYFVPAFQRWICAVGVHMGNFKVQKILNEMLPEALLTMAEIMRDTQVKEATRLLAAKEIVDRVMGKAVQPVETNDTSLKDIIDRLNREKPITVMISTDVIPEPEPEPEEEEPCTNQPPSLKTH